MCRYSSVVLLALGVRTRRCALAVACSLVLAIMLWACALPGDASGSPGAHQAKDDVYAYTDDRGRLVYVNRLDDVPERLRPYARRVEQPGEREGSDLAALVASVESPDPSAHRLYWYM